MADRFHGTLYVSNSEMHGDTDWVRASDYDAAQDRIRELEAAFNSWADNCDCQCSHCERMANRFCKPSTSDRKVEHD